MRRQLYKGRKLSTFALCMIGGTFLFATCVVPAQFKRFVSFLMYPLVCVQHSCINSIRYLNEKRASIDELQARLHNLQQHNDILMAQLIEAKASHHYMHAIEELCAFKKRYQLDRALCVQIISKTFSEQGHTFLVDAGSVQGVQVNMIALYNNVLLGRVEQVYPYYSKVVAISDKGCKVAAYCVATGAAGVHEGGNKKTTVLSHISHLAKVENNDLVLSSGQGFIFPEGFALGRISSTSNNGLFYTIEVQQLLAIEDLSYCMLIHKDMIPV